MDNASAFERCRAQLPITGDLELDLQKHVDLYYEVARGEIGAYNALEQAKFNLAQTEAAVQEGIRLQAEADAEKLTEERVKVRVKQDVLYIADMENQLAASRELKEWQALKSSYEARSHCLHDLTKLACRGVSGTGITEYTALRQTAAAARKLPKR